jgi:enterochelin esterase-like enzyme
LLAVFLFLLLSYISSAQENTNAPVTIIDAQHYSHALGEMRNYRIFLPPDYHHLDREYPVIYFMHGWSQRYFGSGPDAYSEYDQGNDNGGGNIEKIVSQRDVIVVKSDGYNRSKNEAYYLRPYNIGPVETHRQFPIYFEELIQHIDREYRTLADRGHRAISGLSMGGFMSFFIGGKYPHLFSAVGSFCGSPEFVIGPKDMPVEYRHMDLYRNYDGMNVRLHYGDQDFIRGYH